MGGIEATTGGQWSACAYPGCPRPPRPRAGTGGGKPPIYCDLRNESTGNFAHTPVTARREENRRARHAHADGGVSVAPVVDVDSVGGHSATGARERAGTLLEQFRTEVGRLTETIAVALDEFAVAADPDTVRVELDEAHRQVDRIRFEAAEQVKDAHRERDEAMSAASRLAEDRDEAVAVRDQAIDDLERAEHEPDDANAAAEQVRADSAMAIAQVKQEADGEVERVRQVAAAEASSVRAEATEQIRTASRERDEATATANRADAIARHATDDVERLRTELTNLRHEHKKELADLRTDAKAALADQATQLRQVYEAEIARLASQIAAMTSVSDNGLSSATDSRSVSKA